MAPHRASQPRPKAACPSPLRRTRPGQIYREGKDKERVFDLLTLERKRIESFEHQACWQAAAGPEDLQVGAGCGACGEAGSCIQAAAAGVVC